jgi:uncharacterized protein YbjT (DUF2867 family)
MSTTSPDPGVPMLVAGVATGDLGSQVVNEFLARGKNVRALVRPSTHATKLVAQGVQIARGDMLDPDSLLAGMLGADTVITTAAGYYSVSPPIGRSRFGLSRRWPLALGARGAVRAVDDKDTASMFRWFDTGEYLADAARQTEVFGQPPTAKDAIKRVAEQLHDPTADSASAR